MPLHRDCSGLIRRDFLRVGTLGLAGLALPDLLRADQMRSDTPGRRPTNGAAQAAIVVLLEGGPSHIDTFDPKPDATSQVRGEFGAIAASVSGVRLSEHLPKLAAGMGDYALLRGVSHTLADHGLGQEYMMTGTRPLASLRHPDYAAVLCQQRPVDLPLPTTVAIPRSPSGPGFLGPAYGPLETVGFPTAGQPFPAPALRLDLPADRLERREELLRTIDRYAEAGEPALDGLDQFSRRAYEMLRSPQTRDALDLSKESPSFARRFPAEPFAQSCLLAIRLVEAGVRCVTISMGGWDTHQNVFAKLRGDLLPRLDAGLAGLFSGLRQRGLLSSTAVLVTGEFGRTPDVNDEQPSPGRDHYARCMSVLMAGGRIGGGQVVGASDSEGRGPAETAISPDDIAATFYANLGINPATVFETADGRPITLVRDGTAVSQLLS